MKRENKLRGLLCAVNHFLIFFLLVAFVITCCMLLFVSTMSRTVGIELTSENIGSAAKLTFGNVVLLSLLFSIIDALRRRFSVSRPIKKIIDAAEKIIQGDFSVRIKHSRGIFGEESFEPVMDCFNKMAEELSSIETLRSDFVANVSHELKTPLAVMQNYGTLLQQPYLTEEKRIEYAKAVTEACRRLAGLITNILRLNKLENQQIFERSQEYNLSEQLCESLLQFENEWEKKKIAIQTDIQQDVIIRADSELLSLVWSNLLSNAFKFTESGGMVRLSLCADKNYATVCVGDSGCGMTHEVGKHIFEKFYQGDTSHSAGGNGLGLALVRRIVDIVEGEILVESAPGEGSCFTVKIKRR